jgi:perosamine synthetase
MIPIYKPYIQKKEKQYVNKCIDDGWISSRGEFIDIFESKIKEYLDIKNVITVSNGSVSLMLILKALEINHNDDILVPSLTYAATISNPNMLGIRCILFDSDENYQPSIIDLEKRITKNTKAILLPQLYGNSPDMEAFTRFSKEHGIYLIEDSAEVFGSKFKNKNLGTFGISGSFSFFGNKTITTGEGGAVVTDDDDLAFKMRRLKSQNHIENFEHDGPGFNFRMTNIQAAIGCAQIEKINFINNKKIKIAKFYRDNLSPNITSIYPSNDVYSTEWMPLFKLPDEKKYIDLCNYLKDNGIDSRPCFKPIHLMKNFNISYDGNLNISERIYKQGFNLPCYPTLTIKELKKIVNCVNYFVEYIK